MARSNTSLPRRAERCSERRSTPFSAAAARQYSMSPWTQTQTSQLGPDPGGSFPETPTPPSSASRAPREEELEGRPPAPDTSASQTLGTAPHPACFSRRTRAALSRTRLPCSRCLSFAPVARQIVRAMGGARRWAGPVVGGAGLEGHVVPALISFRREAALVVVRGLSRRSRSVRIP